MSISGLFCLDAVLKLKIMLEINGMMQDLFLQPFSEKGR
ncbi:2-dehydropantoate 2-reductase [Bacillus sp. NRRL B-14911]|uniref:Uncharacterized protein n=1 Tax=Bacillus infantis NRRL B-14911 TaxID=1367477 RepID=U5LCU0_9BACI|nr:hypothetical protein N288_12610 [Bacillus infantis NRRL B-14911]EAR66865.1 2-dehydropantoate 2-reductase [Bacillus sp. NRRL B-14911]